MRMNKTLQFAIDFSHKANTLGIKPVELAQLIVLSDRVGNLATRECNGEDVDKRLTKARTILENAAKDMGAGLVVSYSGLYPSFAQGGYDVYLPSL